MTILGSILSTLINKMLGWASHISAFLFGRRTVQAEIAEKQVEIQEKINEIETNTSKLDDVDLVTKLRDKYTHLE